MVSTAYPTLKAALLLRLSGVMGRGYPFVDCEWVTPKEMADYLETQPTERPVKEELKYDRPTDRALKKILRKLLAEKVVSRRYNRPKKFEVAKWKKLSEPEKGKASRSSEWRLNNNSKTAIIEAFKVISSEENPQFAKDFLASDYCKRNKKLIFHLWSKSFFDGEREHSDSTPVKMRERYGITPPPVILYVGGEPMFPSKKQSLVYSEMKNMGELMTALSDEERKIMESGLNSPTFMGIVLNGKRSDELASVILATGFSRLAYIKFVIQACQVVDLFKSVKLNSSENKRKKEAVEEPEKGREFPIADWG